MYFILYMACGSIATLMEKNLAVYQKHKIVYAGFDLAENNSFKTGASEESVNGLLFNDL